MPKLSPSAVPAYRRHKQSGQAVVTLNGRDHLLGKHDSAPSRAEYDRLIAEWFAGGRQLPREGVLDLNIAELVAKFWTHAQTYYVDAKGSPTSEQSTLQQAMNPLLKLYRNLPAREFSPLKLKAVRETMITADWGRGHINKQICRIRQLFKWGASNELVPASVHHGLAAVEGLRINRSAARESRPVQPVPDGILAETLPHLSATIRDMVDLQLVTAMRPGEVCVMRGVDIDTTGKLWIYKPEHHKTQHHGHERTVYLGKRAQEIIGRYLKSNLQAYLFSPVEAEAERRRKQHEQRLKNGTPLSCGNTPGSNRKKKPKRTVGEKYDVAGYRRAIARACERAFKLPEDLLEPVTPNQKAEATAAGRMAPEAIATRRTARKAWRTDHTWHPHQLRHNAATRLRKTYGLEAAQVILGHKTLSVTQIYAEKNVAAAQKIMGEVG